MRTLQITFYAGLIGLLLTLTTSRDASALLTPVSGKGEMG